MPTELKARTYHFIISAGICLALLIAYQWVYREATPITFPASTLEQFAGQVAKVEEEGAFYKGEFHLYVLPAMRDLTRAAPQNVAACLQFLALADKTRRQRFIAITSMSGLGVEARVEFINDLVKLIDADQLPAWWLKHAVFPPAGQSVWFLLHYRDPSVKTFLTAVAAMPEADMLLKNDVARTLSGAAMSDLFNYWKIEILAGRSWPRPDDLLTALWLSATGYLLPDEVAIIAIGLVALAVWQIARRGVRRPASG